MCGRDSVTDRPEHSFTSKRRQGDDFVSSWNSTWENGLSGPLTFHDLPNRLADVTRDVAGRVRSVTGIADGLIMGSYVRTMESRWNWRLSAHARLASLVSLWAVLLFMGPLGWLFAPIAGVRSALSFAQTFFNIRLGRRAPLEQQTRFDWVLVASIFVAAYVAAGIGHFTGNATAPLLFVPLLVPFTVLQTRMMLRSYRTAEIEQLRPATLVRLEDYRRDERQDVRAA